MQNLDALIVLIFYAIALIGIGLWASRRANSEEAFLLAGRGLGSIVAGLAYAASASSAWVLLGFSGFVYSIGPSAMWMVPGIIAGYAAVWFWAGANLQKQAADGDMLTFTDFLAFGLSPKMARLVKPVASIMIVICFSWYIAAQMQGAGTAINDLFGIGLAPAVIIGAVLILIYTFLGGFLAVSLVDTLQGIMMGLVALILPVAALIYIGGPSGITDMLAEQPEAYSGGMGGRVGMVALGFVLGLNATGFGALGQPHLLTWVMATKDKKARIQAGGVAIGWAAMVYAGMGILGLSARTIFGDVSVPEGIFFGTATEVLPGIFSGIIATTTLSAIMSTVDSQLLITGAAFSHDLGLGKGSDKRAVFVSRIAITVVCVVAIGVTLLMPSTIFERAMFAWVALGASFGPTVVTRAIGWRPSGAAVILAMLVGFMLAVVIVSLSARGPSGMFSTIGPWVGGLAVLAADRIRSAATRK